MKKAIRQFFLIIVFLLSSCNRASLVITPTITLTSTITPTATPTPTTIPTETLRPTATPLPPQSANVDFIYKEGEIVLIGKKQIEDTVNVLYPQYASFCGEFPVRVYVSADFDWIKEKVSLEGGRQIDTVAAIGFAEAMFIYTEWPAWIDRSILGWREGVVAHELAHVCQHYLSNSNFDWSVLWEGGANWLASHMVIPWLKVYDNQRISSVERFNFTLFRQVRGYCARGIFSVTDDSKYQIGNAVWNRGIGDDISKWTAYYRSLSVSVKERAFKDTFGMVPNEFEAAYKAECILGFPTQTLTPQP